MPVPVYDEAATKKVFFQMIQTGAPESGKDIGQRVLRFGSFNTSRQLQFSVAIAVRMGPEMVQVLFTSKRLPFGTRSLQRAD